MSGKATVFVVIPVFNRFELTKKCVKCLQSQSYGPIKIIISDGNSTDNSPEKLAQTFPELNVLHSHQELWWGAAMKVGIEYALINAQDHDFVLMMNNDTEFAPDYIETLVRASQIHNAAVGALTVNIKDHSHVLDAGVNLSWDAYRFHFKRKVLADERYNAQVDVLPGRGSLIPVYMIRKAGNINDTFFPHYISDYEFFARLKRNGFNLGISYETKILSHADVTGISHQGQQRLSLSEFWKLTFSRRSTNFWNHLFFVLGAAPLAKKPAAVMAVFKRYLNLARQTTWAYQLGAWLRYAAYCISPPYLAYPEDCSALNLSLEALLKERILGASKTSDGGHPFSWRMSTRRARGAHLKLFERCKSQHHRAKRDAKVLAELAFNW